MEIKLIPISWYYESPIDFEHKQYVLFSYLQSVDGFFYQKKLSPHLLHLEKVLKELVDFKTSYGTIRKNFDKNRYIYLFDNPKLRGENQEHIIEIKEIVDFSIPQMKSRLDFGYKIFQKNRQVLY